MRPLLVILLAALAAGPAHAQNPVPAPAPLLRAKLSDLGGALANEGFKTRDRAWTGRVEAGQPQRLAVNLFRGNQYWFCAAADQEIKNLKVSLFGPDGRPVAGVVHEEPGVAAVGVTAETTGQYFVQVETGGGPASDFCLIYLFK